MGCAGGFPLLPLLPLLLTRPPCRSRPSRRSRASLPPSTPYLYAVCVRGTGKHVRRIVVNVVPTRATKERLSRETVTERALALADAEGIDAVTIRRLATDLGVTPMALYWHFQDKE